MQIDFPLRIGPDGRTATTDTDAHLRQMIEQLLFTAPGERVNRPDFGSGLLQMIFAPNSRELAETTQFLVQAALQQFLGDLVEMQGVAVESEDSTLRVTVQYVVRRTEEQQSVTFTREV